MQYSSLNRALSFNRPQGQLTLCFCKLLRSPLFTDKCDGGLKDHGMAVATAEVIDKAFNRDGSLLSKCLSNARLPALRWVFGCRAKCARHLT
jgi:hypothetical protein